MANNPNAKLKTLYVMQMLQEETDETHGKTLQEIVDRLNSYGIAAERKSLYRDFEILREFELDIIKIPTKPVTYGLKRNDFTLEELMLLVDAVVSCRFLTASQIRNLVTNIKLLGSDFEREQLERHIHVPRRITSQNEGVFSYIDTIHECMRLKKQVRFKYFHISSKGTKKWANDGKFYEETPVAVVFENGFYYLSAWSDEHSKLVEFRIDRMDSVTVSKKDANKSDAKRATLQDDDFVRFGRFEGEHVNVLLSVHPEHVEILLDRFGKSIQIEQSGDEWPQAFAKVCVSPQFFGWIASMDGNVRIEEPKHVRTQYKDYLKKLLAE